jgi:hypothetical protein
MGYPSMGQQVIGQGVQAFQRNGAFVFDNPPRRPPAGIGMAVNDGVKMGAYPPCVFVVVLAERMENETGTQGTAVPENLPG